MERYMRDDNLVFSGNDAEEYIDVCNGVYDNNEKRIAFQDYMSKHIKLRYDLETADIYLDCDFINLDLIDTVMMDCDIEYINLDFLNCYEKNHVAQTSFTYEEDVEYIQNDYFAFYYDDPYCVTEFNINLEAA